MELTERQSASNDAELRAQLSRVGLRVTTWRLLILRELTSLRAATSHPELAKRLCRRGLDRTTVYRNLLVLARAGLLVKTHLPDGIARFQLPRSQSLPHDAHPHFVCSDCGSVACLPASSVALRGEAKRRQVAEVQLRGRCSSCAQPHHPDGLVPSSADTS